MKLMTRRIETIGVNTIMSYHDLDILLYNTTIKRCFRQCTEDEFYSSKHAEKLGSQSFEYAICVIPVNYVIETSY